MSVSPSSDSPLTLSECNRRTTQAFTQQRSDGNCSPLTPSTARVALPSFGLYRDVNAPLWGDSPIALRTQTFVQEGLVRRTDIPVFNTTPDRFTRPRPVASALFSDISPPEAPVDARACWTPAASLQTLTTMPYVPYPPNMSLSAELGDDSDHAETERGVVSPVRHGTFSDVASSVDEDALRLLVPSPDAAVDTTRRTPPSLWQDSERTPTPLRTENGRRLSQGSTLLSGSLSELDGLHTPLPPVLLSTPRTPVDCLIAAPGVVTAALGGGLHSASTGAVAGVRSYTATPQLRSVLETPQKSTRRPHSRVGTPLRFGDKVERLNMSLESHQAQGNVSVRSAGLMEASVRSATGDAITTFSALARDHLSPNRNPFSPYRGYEAPYYMASFDIRRTPPSAFPSMDSSVDEEVPTGRPTSSSRSSRNNSNHAPRAVGQRPRVVHSALRPAAALVLYQQTVQRTRVMSPRMDSLTSVPAPPMLFSVPAVAESPSARFPQVTVKPPAAPVVTTKDALSPLPQVGLRPRPHHLHPRSCSSSAEAVSASSPHALVSPAAKAGLVEETPVTVRGASKDTAGTLYGLSLTPRTSERRLSHTTTTGLSPEGASPDEGTGPESIDHSCLLSAHVASMHHSPPLREPAKSASHDQSERRILFADADDDRRGAVPALGMAACDAVAPCAGRQVLGPHMAQAALVVPLTVHAPEHGPLDHHEHLLDPLAGEMDGSQLLESLTGSTPAQFSATQRGTTAHPPGSLSLEQDSSDASREKSSSPSPLVAESLRLAQCTGTRASAAALTATRTTRGIPVVYTSAAAGVCTPADPLNRFRFATADTATAPSARSWLDGAATSAGIPLSAMTNEEDVDSPIARAGTPLLLLRSPVLSTSTSGESGASLDRVLPSLRHAPRPLFAQHERALFDSVGDLSAVEEDENAASLTNAVDVAYAEEEDAASSSDELEPGDRFQMHHRFQLLHPLPGSVCAAPTFVPLTVDPTGITWLALHRLDGMPYAVKEIADMHRDQLHVELQCLTLGNDPVTLAERQASAFITRYYTCTRTPVVATRQLNGLAAAAVGISACTNVYLLQTEYFPRGSAWEYALDAYRQARYHARRRNSTAEADAQTKLYFCFKAQNWIHLVEHTLKALNALHTHELIHGNPIVHNVFVADLGTFKLGNFGSAVKKPQAYPTGVSAAATLVPRYARATPYEMDVGVFCSSMLALFMALEQLHTAPGTPELDEKHVLAAVLDRPRFDAWVSSVTSLAHLDVPKRLLEALLAARKTPHTATQLLDRWVPTQTQEAYEACQLLNTELLRLALRYEALTAAQSPLPDSARRASDDQSSRTEPTAPPACNAPVTATVTAYHGRVGSHPASAPTTPHVSGVFGRAEPTSASRACTSRLAQETRAYADGTPLMPVHDRKESCHSLLSLDASHDEPRAATPYSATSPFLSPPARPSASVMPCVPFLQLPETTARATPPTTTTSTGCLMRKLSGPTNLGPTGAHNNSSHSATQQNTSGLSRRTPRLVTISSPPAARPVSFASTSALDQTDHVSSTNSSRTHRSLFRPAASLPSMVNPTLASDADKTRTQVPTATLNGWPSAVAPGAGGSWRSSLAMLSPRDAALGQAAAQAASFATDCLKRSLRSGSDSRTGEDSARDDARAETAGSGFSRQSSAAASPAFPRDALLVNVRSTMAMMGWSAISDGGPRALSDIGGDAAQAANMSVSLTSNSGHGRRITTIEEARPLSSLE